VSVHRGHDQLLNRGVTIELLKPGLPDTASEALREKARRMAVTELPNVAALYDQGEEDGRPFLVLEEMLGTRLTASAPLGPDDLVALISAVSATLQAAGRSQTLPPRLDGDAVRFAEGRTQIVDWGLPPAGAGAPDAMAALAQLLALAATGAPTGKGGRPAPAPIMRVVNRALTGEYTSPVVLEDELRAAVKTAEQPTMEMPRAQPTMVLPPRESAPPPPPPVNRRRQVAPPLSAPAATVLPAVRPRRRMWPVGLGLLLLITLLAAAWLRNTPITFTGGPPTNAGSTAPAAASAAPQGQPYVVATRDGQRLNVRSGPGRDKPVVTVVTNGTVVRVVGGPVAGDGFTWVHIQANGIDGWVVQGALQPK
jgi:hypothetical protein